MNSWEQEIVEALLRLVKRRAEEDFIQCLKTTKLQLTLLSKGQTATDLDPGDFAELEELK